MGEFLSSMSYVPLKTVVPYRPSLKLHAVMIGHEASVLNSIVRESEGWFKKNPGLSIDQKIDCMWRVASMHGRQFSKAKLRALIEGRLNP